jgi:hypothetical protein
MNTEDGQQIWTVQLAELTQAPIRINSSHEGWGMAVATGGGTT